MGRFDSSGVGSVGGLARLKAFLSGNSYLNCRGCLWDKLLNYNLYNYA